MNAPRKHHFLPQFYLRGFAADGLLERIDKGSLESIHGRVRNLAAIRDYHRLDADDVDDQFALEKQLGEIEGQLAASLRSVLDAGISDDQTHARLIELVSLLRMRVPAVKSFIEQSLEQVVRSTGQMLERHGQLPTAPVGLEDALTMDNIGIQIRNWICLKFMFEIASSPDVLRIMISMKPTLIDAQEGACFITSDQPVGLFNPRAEANTPYGCNLTDLDTELTLALSSSKALRLSWAGDAPDQQVATIEEVDEINRRTIIMAENFVFAREFSESILNQVRVNSGRRAGFEPPQVLDAGDAAYHLNVFRPVLPEGRYE